MVSSEKCASVTDAIRDIEEEERRAVLAGDVPSIETFWDPELLVNGPHGALLVGRDSTLDMVKARIIDFRRFDRKIECIQIEDGLAVTNDEPLDAAKVDGLHQTHEALTRQRER